MNMETLIVIRKINGVDVSYNDLIGKHSTSECNNKGLFKVLLWIVYKMISILCMCVYTHAYIHTHTHTHIYICVCVCMYVYFYTHIFTLAENINIRKYYMYTHSRIW